MQSDPKTIKTLNAADLTQFTGSEQFFRHTLNRGVLYSEGAQYLAEHAGAYWLLDEIALIQPYDQNVAAEEFQVWTLTVRPDKDATLTCDDGNGNVVLSKEIPYTDFSLDTVKLYFANDVIHLPLSIETEQTRATASQELWPSLLCCSRKAYLGLARSIRCRL